MTRENKKTISMNFKNKKEVRILETLRLFTEHDGKISDEDLANELNSIGIQTSRSSVERDLNTNLKEYYISLNEEKFGFSNLTETQLKIIAYVKQKRLENKINARKKGGTNSSINNVATKDEKGHFNGNKKRL